MRQISIGALHVFFFSLLFFPCMRDRSYGMTIRRVEDGKSKYSGSGTKGNRFVPQVIYLNFNYCVYIYPQSISHSIFFSPSFLRVHGQVTLSSTLLLPPFLPNSRSRKMEAAAIYPHKRFDYADSRFFEFVATLPLASVTNTIVRSVRPRVTCQTKWKLVPRCAVQFWPTWISRSINSQTRVNKRRVCSKSPFLSIMT